MSLWRRNKPNQQIVVAGAVNPTHLRRRSLFHANGRPTSFNGETITYDEIGNPLNYRGGMIMSWEKGRQLKSIGTGGGTYTYTYNSTGTHVGKSVGDLCIRYITHPMVSTHTRST